MKKISIAFPRKNVFEGVTLSTAYRGVRGKEGAEDAERVTLSGSDARIFHTLFDEAVGTLLPAMRPCVCGVVNSSETLELSLSLSFECSEALLATFRMEVEEYLKCYILSHWLDVTLPEEGAKTASRLPELLLGIQQWLCHRDRPKRPSASPLL